MILNHTGMFPVIASREIALAQLRSPFKSTYHLLKNSPVKSDGEEEAGRMI